MALVLNYNRNASGFRGRQLGSTGFGGVLIGWDSPGRRKNRTINWGGVPALNTASVPNGRTHPSAWLMPQRTGGVSSYRAINGSASVSGTFVVPSAVSATIAGAASVTGLLSSITQGQLLASITAVGSSAINGFIKSYVSADISLAAALSPQSIATAVWGATASANNDTGSMGEKLNDAGAAANPWTEEIEPGLDAKDAMRLVSAAVAGKLSGAAGPTVTIRNAVADSRNRITANVDDDGNRTSITYDLTD